MKTIEFDILRAAARALLLASALAVAGCAFGSDESEGPGSGDPEADRRAEMRVGGGGGAGGRDDGKPGRTLYERLGGYDRIAELVDDFTARSLADPRVNFERRNVTKNWLGVKYDPWEPTPENQVVFKQRMIDFIALAAGGPADYSGRDMRTVHDGMRITNSEFDAMVGDIKASMDKLGFAARETRDLLAIIETTRKQIVEEH